LVYDLSQQGYIIACVDGRGTGFKGADFKKSLNYSWEYEVDQIDAASFRKINYVDASRIGILDGRMGGFMSSNCILKVRMYLKWQLLLHSY
jgi:dipeptidyl-peptidase-4